MAGKIKLSRQNTSRLPSFQGHHVNCGTANQPACGEPTTFASSDLNTALLVPALSGHLDQQTVAASDTGGVIRHKAWRDPWT